MISLKLNKTMPRKDNPMFRRNCRSTIQTPSEHFESMFGNENMDEGIITSRPNLDRFQSRDRTKSILNINKEAHSERKSLIDDRFRLIGADLRKTLKAKIDGKLKQYQKLRYSKAYFLIYHR